MFDKSKLTAWFTRRRLITIGIVVLLYVLLRMFLARPVELPLIEPSSREVVEVVVASGRLRAVRESQLGAEAAGLVEELRVREGDRVQRGQLLGTLRPGEIPARFAQVRAGEEAARKTLEAEEAALRRTQQEAARAEELAKRQLIANTEAEKAATELQVQRARTEAARARLAESLAEIERVRPEFARREVRAPFDGVILRRLVEPGTSVTGNTTWFSIAEMGDIELYVETDENNVGKLAVRQPAIAVTPAYPDQAFAATLMQIGPNVDTERGVIGLRLIAAEVPPFMLPNMTVDVSIEVERTPSKLALPASAIGAGEASAFVLQLEQGRLVRTPVTVIGRNPEWVAVTGIEPGVKVLRNIRQGKEGQRVRN
jgi:HlyD family secretion protein